MDVNLDGIVISTTSWKCLPLSIGNMSIFGRLECKIVSSSWLKGSAIASSPIIVKVYMTEYSGFDLSIVLQSDNRIDFKYVLNHIYNSFYDALNDNVMAGRNTSVRYSQMRGKENFLSSSSFVVFIEDIEIFGSVLHHYVNNRLPEYKPLFVLCKFGQSGSFQRMASILSSISSMEDVCELVLHVAYDLPADQGKILLWNRSVVFDKMNHINNLYTFEYFVGGIPGYGNFTFESKVHEPTMILGSSKLKKIKFYSSLGKYLSSQPNVPFSQPKVSELLLKLSVFDKQEIKDSSKLTECFQDINCIRGIVDKIQTESQYARCELIINATIRDSIQETLQDVRTLAESIVLQLELTKCIQQFTSQRMYFLIDRTVGCCLDTILEQLVAADEAIANRRNYLLPIDKYKSLLTCEAIVCFMFRGSAVSTGGVRRHDNQLLRVLELVPGAFRDSFSRSEYLFDAISTVVKIENGKVCFHGPTEFLPQYLSKLKLDPAKDFTFGDLFNALHERSKIAYAAKIVAAWIFSCTIYNLLGRKQSSTNCALTHRSVASCKDLTIGSGYEVVKLLGNSSSSIMWIIDECRKVAERYGLKDCWTRALACELEKCGFRNKDYVCFNYGALGDSCIIVLPYICLNLDKIHIAVPIWVNVITSVLNDETESNDKVVLAAQVEVLLQRSVEKLSSTQRASVKIRDMIGKLFDNDGFTNCQSEEYKLLFQNPFPF